VEDRRFSMIDSLNTSVNLHGEVSTKPGQLQGNDSQLASLFLFFVRERLRGDSNRRGLIRSIRPIR